MEGEGKSEMEYTDIDTSADSIDSSVIFHVVTDILGFVLYMHQQIPSILQDLSLEYESLRAEYKDLDTVLAQSEVKVSIRREHVGRKREVKQGIRRLDNLMNSVSSLRTALQVTISEVPHIEQAMLVLGASPLRPQQVYELFFSHGRVVLGGTCDFTKNKATEGLSRKAIRALISKGAGSDSYAGPTKLFLLVKAPSSFNLPLHFLPKRDFRYSKKVVPFRLRFKCRTQDPELGTQHSESQSLTSIHPRDSTSNDLMWFQCRHIIKGFACRTSPTEE
ncbi:unnamed protein product [Ilex paraguariensis]|uniref:Uncharacterized protein n=1 Tax=Ilex paraguariensis TaxID=185542 RepID=A0ABC8S4B2_9AQUA